MITRLCTPQTLKISGGFSSRLMFFTRDCFMTEIALNRDCFKQKSFLSQRISITKIIIDQDYRIRNRFLSGRLLIRNERAAIWI